MGCAFDHVCGVANKHYSNKTLERTLLDPSDDKEFIFDSCEWYHSEGIESGQCIFLEAQVEDTITLVVKWCYFEDCAGAVHIISTQQPTIKQCIFLYCNSFGDACVVYEQKMTERFKRKDHLHKDQILTNQNDDILSNIECTNLPENKDIWKQAEQNVELSKRFGGDKPLCMQSTFFDCTSQGRGGGLLIKNDMEKTFVLECDFSGCRAKSGGAIYFDIVNLNFLRAKKRLSDDLPYCVYASYFAINRGTLIARDVFIMSESDYDDGLKFFSLCKTTQHSIYAVVQTLRSEQDKNIYLRNSFETAQRIIELNSASQYSAACGSSPQQPCQTIPQALEHVFENENLMLTVPSNAKTSTNGMCNIDSIDLEINGNNGGTIVFDCQNEGGFTNSFFGLSAVKFILENLTMLLPKNVTYKYDSIIKVNDPFNSSTILLDHVIVNSLVKSNGLASVSVLDSSLTLRNVTANLTRTSYKSGGFLAINLNERAGFVITNSSFISCSAKEYAGALKVRLEKGATSIFDQITFMNNSAKQCRDMSTKEVQIGCFDDLNYKTGIDVWELLSPYNNQTIFFSSSRGTDFTRCGTRELPCRTLIYGWEHLVVPRTACVIDLVYLTTPQILTSTSICSSSGMGIVGKIEVSPEFSGTLHSIITFNESSDIANVNFILRRMKGDTMYCIDIIGGFSLIKDIEISFAPMTDKQSIDYVLFHVELGGLLLNNVLIQGEDTLISAPIFGISFYAQSIQLRNIVIDKVHFKSDVIAMSFKENFQVRKNYGQFQENVLISNFSFKSKNGKRKINNYLANDADEILEGRFLRRTGSLQQRLEISNSTLNQFTCSDGSSPWGGCVCWRNINSKGVETEEEEENSELLFSNCSFSDNGINDKLSIDMTKGGAIFLEFNFLKFPFAFKEVDVFRNRATIGRDIFLKCPSISNKEESQKIGINFRNAFWKEENSIGAESEEDRKIVDYLNFVAYRSTSIYVNGLKESTKQQSELISLSNSYSSHMSLGNTKREAAKQAGGLDIFFCGKEAIPCHTVNYAMTHLVSSTALTPLHLFDYTHSNSKFARNKQKLKHEEEQLILHVIGEASLFISVSWVSLCVRGETDDAGLLLENTQQTVDQNEALEQPTGQREGDGLTDADITIKGKCSLSNTNVKINADLPVKFIFLINEESTFTVEHCIITSAKQEMTIPTLFKIDVGSLICELVNVNKFIGTNVSISSYMPGNGFFLAASNCGSVQIQNCSFAFVDTFSSTGEVQENTENDVCTWNSSFISFVDSYAFLSNTTFRTKQEGAIYTENSYLVIDAASLKGNSVGIGSFLSVAHNVRCRIDESKIVERIGVIQLLQDKNQTGSEDYTEGKKVNQWNRNSEDEEKEIQSIKNFWIEKNNCALYDFPLDLMSSMFTPQPKDVTTNTKGKYCEVTLTGKCLVNCGLLMKLLANKTNAGKVTNELIEIAESRELSCSHENAVSAIFPLDVVERTDESNVYVVLKFLDEVTLNHKMTTVPLCVIEGKELSGTNRTIMIIVITVSTVIVMIGVCFTVAMIFLRKRLKRKLLLTEYGEKKPLLSSINSDASDSREKGKANQFLSGSIFDYGSETKQIEIPSDSQEPYLEE
ncbi:uncharacterized protein MONOS_8499 [Monocercomonoides exilis]|uniref:uncharacterized protein n=1 Tax=Monocercomonoides exilis TaxID=2049356 RepID=UPI00355A3105|nr:hypothetical protein MONOS_8499 [Monocercomonoides exilis]|eukprot:MONOS_8499.1-p1 / transcript=MONOS_8499.1 / gene=MONOS_8499 / organism=Monocercomonoides_exilis_PA203 / gene_product=unspecified product / transcript_product=unspecified product / location=Mono_scaffold00322:1844-7498(+) / protein_length=1607 / sequence_SO=supercontig / SO=protein_coding / is_pseudo=false